MAKKRKITLKSFIREYNKYMVQFGSWSSIHIRDYKERNKGLDVNHGNLILCINTSTFQTMKRMLLAYYLAVINNDKVYFTYVWLGDVVNYGNVELILDDMSLMISAFVKDKYSIDARRLVSACGSSLGSANKAIVVTCAIREENFRRTMYESATIKEIYYSPLHVMVGSSEQKSMIVSQMASIPLNVAKSVAKPSTLLISGDKVIVMSKEFTYNNTHIDNVIKASLTNPPLINTTAVYNRIIPEPKIRRQTISITGESEYKTGIEPEIIAVDMDIKPPTLRLTLSDLESTVFASDIDYKTLLANVKQIQRYYDDIGIGDFVRKPGLNNKEQLIKYLLAHMKGELMDNVLNMETDRYEFVKVGEEY